MDGHNFQEVMRHWKRMCDTYTTEDAATCCNGCPMDGKGCGAIYEDDNADFGVIEREVMAWAEENPEPEYPAWWEWLYNIGAVARELRPDMAEMVIATGLLKPIPADIAQKYGIEPKGRKGSYVADNKTLGVSLSDII